MISIILFFFGASKKNSSPPRGRACVFFCFQLIFLDSVITLSHTYFQLLIAFPFGRCTCSFEGVFGGVGDGERLRERVRACMCVSMCWSKFPLSSLLVVVLVLLPCLPESQFRKYEQIVQCPLNLNPNLKVTKWVYVVDDIQTFLHSNLVLQFAHLQ